MGWVVYLPGIRGLLGLKELIGVSKGCLRGGLYMAERDCQHGGVEGGVVG